MSSDASRQVATPRLDSQFYHATSPMADLTPASTDAPRKLDEYPFPAAPQSVRPMSTPDVPEPRSAAPQPAGFLLQDVIHLFHCPLCKKLFQEPVTLPCVDRLEGFRCPFSSCTKEHTLGDCGVDVTLNKLSEHIRHAIGLQGSTDVTQPVDDVATRIQSTTSKISQSRSIDRNTEAAQDHKPSPQTAPGHDFINEDRGDNNSQDTFSFAQTQRVARSELDCQVCYALYHDPLTTGCGHTFCRSCLHRILDHSRYCPICRRRLSINPLLNRASCPSNASLTRIIETFWTDELASRKRAVEAEEAARLQDFETPLFVCTLAFPQMPTFLHVFEPRYRLLIRRALEGDKTFGMVLPKRPRQAGDAHFHELGTLLRIENVQFFPDGRCLIETVGLSRFRVQRHGVLDGYTVSSVQRIDDISLEEEEATEAAEMAAAAAADATPFPPPPDAAPRHSDDGSASGGYASSASTTPGAARPTITVPSLETMTTQDLMQLATDFVRRMRDQSVPWMTDRMLAIYGACPVQHPSIFPWWLASVLPVKDAEKYRLLGSASVRERLKICCKWIIEWETRTWSFNSCSIL
ncbi:hypothetical protein ACQRIT_005042 [Beauveria bassiana]